MTDESRRHDPADDDHIADSFDIDEIARRHPVPPSPSSEPSGSGAGTAQPPPESGDTAPDVGPDPAAQPVSGPEPRTSRRFGLSRRARRHRKARKAAKQRRKAPWWELPALVALAIAIAILVKTFLIQPFYIPSESMEKTLHGCPGCSGDRILVSKIIYDFRDPEPGDIVVFNAPKGWNDEPPSTPPSNPVVRVVRGFGQLIGFVPPDGLVLVKRVIATGGQTVKGDAAGHVYISNNGVDGPYRKLDESYAYETGPDPRAKFGPITVPQGRLWVMGDHRYRSADSRYHCGPGGVDGPDNSTCDKQAATVPVRLVIGKAVLIAWPPSRWTTLGTPKTFDSAAAALTGTGLLPAVGVFPLWFALRRRRRSGRRAARR
ncbi:MAG: signal peptidase I [Jatrophihabitantaceae bacterium]